MDEEIREYVLRRDKFKCSICGSIRNLEIHHIISRSQGGSDDPENLITLCHRHHVTATDNKIDMEYYPGQDRLIVEGYDGKVWKNENNEDVLAHAHSLHDKLTSLIDMVQATFWEIGGVLIEIDNNNAWEKLCYESFDEYVSDPDVDINYHSAKKLMRIRRRFGKALDRGTVTEQQILDMKMEKADRISKFVGNKNFEEWVHKAVTLSQEKLKQEIKESRKGRPKSFEEKNDNLGKPKHQRQSVSNDIETEPTEIKTTVSSLARELKNLARKYNAPSKKELLAEEVYKLLSKEEYL